ncbi:MAG: hypothetical protein H6695_12200 [Deferribacteres bacterium]|nr:hypothetical protein [candidate division KSB1 bacterium]MCB9510943.1 hypothetical protein [Deferribacteres bacterium]
MFFTSSNVATEYNKKPKVLYVSWAENCSRSDHTARELGGASHMIYIPQLGSHPATIILKYFGQFFMTLKLLFREKPGVVFVMSPPVIAVLPVYLYALLKRIPYVIDSHTAAFLMPRWKRFQGLQRWLERRAATTIVHNEHLAEIVRKGGGHTTIVRDMPIEYNIGERYPMKDGFSVAAVCSFNYDEPIEAIMDAARQVPDVQFYMTGNAKHLAPELKNNLPENVKLTGFISDAAYGSLIQDADVVMSLTIRDHTMLRAAYEGIYQGTPVLISNWQLLRNAFPIGAAHVDNSANSIAEAIRNIQSNKQKFKAEAEELRARKYEQWQQTKLSILERIDRK